MGSILVNGLARSNASLNVSSGTWRVCKYLTPLKNAESWVASLSISSSLLNSCATFSPLRIATSMSFPRLSTASRYAALQMSEETVTTPMSTPRAEWLVEEFSSRLLVWATVMRLLWSGWVWAVSSLAVVDSSGVSRVWLKDSELALGAVRWELESELLAWLAWTEWLKKTKTKSWHSLSLKRHAYGAESILTWSEGFRDLRRSRFTCSRNRSRTLPFCVAEDDIVLLELKLCQGNYISKMDRRNYSAEQTASV